MSNFVPSCEHFEFEGTTLTCDNSREVCVFYCFFSDALIRDGIPRSGLTFGFRFESECKTSIIRAPRSSAGIPSIRHLASREICSSSVELCETHVCFLHIQLIGTNVWLPNTPQCSTWRWFRIFKISCKIRSLNFSQLTLLCSVSHMTILFVLNCAMNVRDQTRQMFCLKLWSIFVIARASLLTDHRISGLPIRAKYRHVKTMCGHTSDNFPTAFSSFGLSLVHFCFSFILAFLDILLLISGHKWSGLDVAYSFVSLRPDHMYPSGGFSFNQENCWKPVHESDKSVDPSMFKKKNRCGFPAIHPS